MPAFINWLFGIPQQPKVELNPRVIHWLKMAPTFALLDDNEQADELAHSLDGIREGREYVQSLIMLLRDRVSQDNARIIELESLMAATSQHTLARREAERSSGNASAQITEAAKANYVSTAAQPIQPNPNRGVKLQEAGELLRSAVKGA